MRAQGQGPLFAIVCPALARIAPLLVVAVSSGRSGVLALVCN